MARRFKEETDYYERHRRALVRMFNGRWIVIKHDHVLGDFKTRKEAQNFVTEEYGPKNCFIRKVTPRISRSAMLYYSRFTVV